MSAAAILDESRAPHSNDGLERAARELAFTQKELARAEGALLGYFHPPRVARALERAHRHLSEDVSTEAGIEKAAEWFLDNYYIVRRVARQVEDELPRRFVRHLPLLAAGPGRGQPRVDAMARSLVASSDLTIDLHTIRRFVDAYQEVSPLTIAELWALPSMLRAAVLQHLLAFLAALHVPVYPNERVALGGLVGGEPVASEPLHALDPVVGVEQSIHALRVLDVIDWKSLFEATSRVEAILKTDPARVYARMDFETSDSYRKVVELLAWGTGRSEVDVATSAIALAADGVADERRGHVGYYLVAEGRRRLEEQLGYRPVGMERLRTLLTRWPTTSYLVPLTIFTWTPILGVAAHLAGRVGEARAPPLHSLALAVFVMVSVVPVSVLSVAVLHWLFAKLLPPRTLPKLDFDEGLPTQARTLVVIPALLGSAEDVGEMIHQLELHYLCNPDPELQFAVLTDDVDVRALGVRSDALPLLERASQGVAALNIKHGKAGVGPFHLLHRRPRWNPAEERFMGWERKRGKLEELNRLLRGDTTTTYALHVGAPQGLLGIRFVITLDSDTTLPMGSARRMVGLLSHPLNRAVFDAVTDRVIAGYTIVQPRVETSPASARSTLFSRIFAGDVGFDIYTQASSEIYQDLFGAGIYVGKGVYDVDAFMRSVDRRVPENALVSHDLFEGVHGRTALATDIVVFEGYPERYVTYAKRMHRWVRGDWQLLPWLFSNVPSTDGGRRSNKLAFIDRWKIADNLRRSVISPSFFVLLVLGWISLPGHALAWTLATLALFLAPAIPSALRQRHTRFATLGRVALGLTFLAYEASVVVDAIVRVIVRTMITKKHLLQWASMAHTANDVKSSSARALCWKTMMASPILALGIAGFVAWRRPNALPVALPLLLLWTLAPEIARWVSEPRRQVVAPIGVAERRRLRLLARRTWRFFDTFVGPQDQWLPIDNHQEEPHAQTAHRTSPTNIGLMFLATLSAYDFGYIGPTELSARLRLAFESIRRMQHHQGHLLNWYETKNLQPLLPRYVSTVDSGNLAGCLIALKHGLSEVMSAPIVRVESWDGLSDTIEVLEDVVQSVPLGAADSLRSVMARMRYACQDAREHLDQSYPTLRLLSEVSTAELDRELLAFLQNGAHRHEPDLLAELRASIERLHQELRLMRRELDTLLPWLRLETEAAEHAITLPKNLRLDEIAARSLQLRADLEARVSLRRSRGDMSPSLEASAGRIDEALRSAAASATLLFDELVATAASADAEVREMDWKLLYDGERRLFHIGYNVTSDQLDGHYYDLLASEARLASYVAITQREVPQQHWYALGRPMTQVAGAPALLSWGGTMFEYLMPSLVMRSQPGTLLERTCSLAIEAQIAQGKQRGEPWGISESAYARVDADFTYQYRSFGGPGLGFRRGLEEDHVVTPYASLLAISYRPREVCANLRALESKGMLGTYGLFEAIDFTPGRQVPGVTGAATFTIVRSYMAHHQGMLLVALGNYLNARSMVDRFHAEPQIETGEPLLNERAPGEAPVEWPMVEVAKNTDSASHVAAFHPPAPWSPSEANRPSAFVLSNGRLSCLLTASGSGGLRWRGLALTHHELDPTYDDAGVSLYLRDEQSRRIWFATSIEGRTTYALHHAEFHRRHEGISAHVDIAVAAADDVEVRQVTLHNETDRPRTLTVTSAGRPVLLEPRRAESHPAFTSMFIESEHLAELDALLFARRLQSMEDESAVLVHRLVREGEAVSFAGFESDRAAFFGRGASHRAPSALAGERRGLAGGVGAVLDPLMALMARVELEPKGSVTLAFVTSVARSREAALELSRKYGSVHTVRWTFRDAEQAGRRRLARANLEPHLLAAVQRLLSALLYSDPAHREPPEVRAVASPCQRRLWGRGISGDHPIVALRVYDPNAELVDQTIAAQRFLRTCGVRLDLILIAEEPSGYLTDAAGALRSVLIRNDSEDWRNRSGGIFVVSADQLPEKELRDLCVAARVVLDTRHGSLAAHMDRQAQSPPKLPRFQGTIAEQNVERPRPRPKLLYRNGFGGFTEDGREYVIEVTPNRPTPAPWSNVLANEGFGCMVSESSLGVSWSENSGENRLTPWSNDAVFDRPSEALYLRDEESASVWSTTPRPAGRGGQTLVRHGAGYTTYERESHGLIQELTIFVPKDAPLKVARLRLKNTLDRHRRLTATYYAEWVLGSRRQTQRPYVISELNREHRCLLATCSWDIALEGRFAFLASKEEVHGFSTDRADFLGRGGNDAHPEGLQRWGLSDRVLLGADPAGALQVHLELHPGEEIETHFLLGQAGSRHDALAAVARFRGGDAVEKAWQELKEHWDQLLGSIRIKTPEPSMDILVNRWLLYQTLSARVLGRTAFYQSSGAFGYRDQLQDVMALFHAAPQLAREHILNAARHQFEEGDVLHWWHPPAARGVRTRCSDDMAWLPYVTGEYVAATGDDSILNEQLAFLKGDPLKADEHDRYAEYENSGTEASLFEHCQRAVARALTAGRHGLPLMGDGDWNDGMNRVGREGRGESVWLGWFLCAVMNRLALLAERQKDAALASQWRARAEALRGKLMAVAWDGGWYLRAFHDDGSLIGSARSRECRIDSIAQSWAVLSRVGTGDRTTGSFVEPDAQASAAVRAADSQLVRESDRLVLLFWPPFQSPFHDPGYIRAYPPGVRENGGQYTHAATWLGLAHASLGDGARAERIFRLLNPILRSQTPGDSARYRVEPYALAADIYSCAPWVGRGGWTWYTGAAAWLWRLGVEGILGIHKQDGDLRIDPCIPPDWEGFEAWVAHRDGSYHIVVENPDRVASGVAAISIDGQRVSSNVIAMDATGAATREVRVTLGNTVKS